MAAITAAMVKDLRETTGAGMMDCKAALTAVEGDFEAAVDWLRKKGLSKAAKKADRIAADGLIGVTASGKSGAVVEVNSETDFVARNDKFQDLVRQITSLAPAAGGDLAKLQAMTFPGKSVTVDEHLKEMIATIGENMTLRRTAAISVGEGAVSSYIHNKVADGVGKIGEAGTDLPLRPRGGAGDGAGPSGSGAGGGGEPPLGLGASPAAHRHSGDGG